MNRRLKPGFQGGNVRAGGGQQRAGLLHVQITGQPLGKPVAGERERPGLRPEVFPGDHNPALITAHRHIIARHLAQQRHPGGPPVVHGGGHFRPGGLRRAPRAPKHIQFPRGVKARLIYIIVKRHPGWNGQ